jgi:hypothetical protein
MNAIDRHPLARAILYGGAAADLALTPGAPQAMRFEELGADGRNDLVEKAQVVAVSPARPRPRHRRCCWRGGGRRVRGWRWV